MNQVKLIFVGGFLGAGKTTLATTINNILNSNNYLSVILDGDSIRNQMNQNIKTNKINYMTFDSCKDYYIHNNSSQIKNYKITDQYSLNQQQVFFMILVNFCKTFQDTFKLNQQNKLSFGQ